MASDSRFKIPKAITNQGRTGDIAILGNNLVDQAWQRLATITAVIGPVGTIDDLAQCTALLRHQLTQARVHGIQGGHIIIATANAGLVGGHGDGITRLAQPGDGLDAAGDGNPLVHGLDVGIGVLVDDPVAIQNDEFVHG